MSASPFTNTMRLHHPCESMAPPLALALFFALLHCISGDFAIAAPNADFELERTPSPDDERSFAAATGARAPNAFGNIAALGYSDNVGGVQVSFGASMVALSGGSAGSAAAGGRRGAATTAGVSGPQGFGMALSHAIGAQFGRDGPAIVGGAGGAAGVGDTAFAAHGGRSARSAAARVDKYSQSVANADSLVDGVNVAAVHGLPRANTVNKTELSSAATGRVLGAGGGATVASADDGSAALATGSGVGDALRNDSASSRSEAKIAGAGAAGVSVAGEPPAADKAASASAQSSETRGSATSRAKPGTRGTAAGAATTGGASADSLGAGSRTVRMIEGRHYRRLHPKFVYS